MTARIHARVRVLLLALAAACLASAADAQPIVLRGPSEGPVRALLIGIDAYRNVRPLKGAVSDVRDIENSLRRTGVTDLTTLVDAAADRDSILRQMDALLARTGSGDLVLISIAGHGAQEPERVKGSQPDGMDSVFLLPGFDTTAAGSKQRIIGTEFNHFIKQFEERGARVLFVADTCHGGGMTRDIDPRGEAMSFRQVPLYRIPDDAYVPVSTTAEAFLTELDFEKTVFLAAVDRKTKAPEVRIPGVGTYRGALSYAVARALEGLADANGDGKITLKELFGYVRQVVYQLSDQRQNPVTLNSPHRNIEDEVAFEVTRAVTILGLPAQAMTPVSMSPAVAQAASAPERVRIASLDGKASRLTGLRPREAAFDVVPPSQGPDLVWDPATGDVLAGADVVAYRMQEAELPSAIDRASAVRALKQIVAKAPQSIRVVPSDAIHRSRGKAAVEVGNLAGRALILFNIAGDGTVQMLYPLDADPRIVRDNVHRLPVEVRAPFGADVVVAVTSAQPMPMLEQALGLLDQRRGALQALNAVERFRPADGRIGSASIFTAP